MHFVSVVPFCYVPDREEEQAEGDDDHDERDCGGNCQHKGKKQNTLKGKGSRNTCDSNMKSTVKPSFPAKKRVQVPQHPFPEAPERLAPFEGQLCEIAKEEPIRNSTILKEKPVLNDKGEPMLSPFFWLREDDGIEKSSQHTDEEEFMDMPPVNVPSFSDIKDSDDEYPSNLTPTVSSYFISSLGDDLQSSVIYSADLLVNHHSLVCLIKCQWIGSQFVSNSFLGSLSVFSTH